MGQQIKKKSRSLSLTDEEFGEFLAQAELHGLERSDYLLALVEADKALSLEVILDARKRRVLRPRSADVNVAMAAEGQASYGAAAVISDLKKRHQAEPSRARSK